MKNIAIVAVGYNRLKSLQRLLISIEEARYDIEDVHLYISIDNSGDDSIVLMASNFIWTHGPKTILTYPYRLGLKNHILRCGDLLLKHDAIIVLEDDLMVSEWFYQYAQHAVAYYSNDDRIAGISLYNYQWNEFVNYPFIAAPSEFSTYFLQLAQSWGQIWMKKQWADFKEWMQQNDSDLVNGDNIPESVCAWKSSSWKKFHIKYCVEQNKYFVQPYISFATCFSEIGEHCVNKMTILQVPLYSGTSLDLRFPAFTDEGSVFYDVFFERKFLQHHKEYKQFIDTCFDLYGSKKVYDKRYLVSIKELPYLVKEHYALEMKPQEENILKNIKGNDIFLYDTTIKASIPQKNSISVFRYRHDIYEHTRELVFCVWDSICKKIKYYLTK